MNWTDIHRRVDALRAALEHGGSPSREQINELLRRRAKSLAQEPEKDISSGESLEIVEFTLAHENYGVESSYVREIYPLKDLTALPGTPGFVLGIMNVRGQILSVIDLRKFFDLPEKGLTDLNKVIIVRDGRMELGLLADAVRGAHAVALADIQSSLPTLTGVREQYLRGVTNDRLIILALDKLLGDPKIVVQEEVETS